MADEDMAAFERLRERVDGQGRFIERLDEKMSGKLGKDDATKLMDYAAAGDAKLREDFLGRMGDLRSAVRDGFQHNERETAASIYKAVTESEGRSIKAVTESEARLMAAVNALNAAITQGRGGIHPMWTYGSGGFSVASVIALILYFSGFKLPGVS